ncbi:MAG: DALR anticodon-binding domain-containing protein, partial [Patescibacteria group bacterium]|nr:DALR anticodon-binding domain-containing protein [Patescibacteria group bacterium]
LNLIKELIRFPDIIENTATDYQVQRLPNYALELVSAFHKFYEECRVLTDDKKLAQARLGLVKATKIVLENTLDLMGISAPEKM